MIKKNVSYCLLAVSLAGFAGCAAKIVGDPKKPITIEAHVTIDIRGLKNTANDIENQIEKA
jgi:hypothetical protein